jgi:hypothetical protein
MIRTAAACQRLPHQLEVCPLSRGVMFQPLSGPLQSGIRFFQPPIPAQPTAFLTVRLPEPDRAPAAIRAYHVPHALHDRVRACLFAGGPMATCPVQESGQPTTYLLVSAIQQLGHLRNYDVYQQFTFVAHIGQPRISTPLLLGVSTPQLHSHRVPLWGHFVRRASHPTVTSDASLLRLLPVAW